MKIKVNVKKTDERAILPTYGSEFAAGADLYSCSDTVEIEAGKTLLIHTGIAIELPVGYVGLVYARSGLASKKGLAPANKVGVIDCDYRGEIMVALHNHSDETRVVERGER
ncbi:MAG: dUTP diphosphatase, partial [Clostridia bacterium]|nr:dUTP diphosphatase [Clostridia bacterium]